MSDRILSMLVLAGFIAVMVLVGTLETHWGGGR